MRPPKTIFRFRPALLITGLVALWGPAAAQTPIQGVVATNSAPTAIALPATAPVANQPSQVAPADESVDSIRNKAEAGDATSQYNLGICYQNGAGVEKDPGEAAKWFRKAADQGMAPAEFNLGVDYLNGRGVEKIPDEAIKWFRKAAEQGYVHAEFNLGNLYYDGVGVAKDASMAAIWYSKAAELGEPRAQCNLGLAYAKGDGVTKDSSVAVRFFLAAAVQGEPIAQYHLGFMYLRGEGVTQDYNEALAWFIISSSLGYEDSTKERDLIERNLGIQGTLQAQQRSREILKIIERSKQSGSADKEGYANQTIGNQPRSSGTGVFVSQDGILITAAHVIRNALAIKVFTQQGIKSARVIKIDAANDVAVIKCEGQFQAVPIKSSGDVKLGQPVFTVGFPDIQLQGFSPKMTQGEISSLSGIQDDPRDWQISVPVQPGNSGGPLFDAHGNVIGLVVAKLDAVVTAQATGALPEDVNYAVKTAYILPLLDAYKANLSPEASSTISPEKTEDVVGRVQNSVVLILVY